MNKISPPTEVQAKPVTTPATSFSYLSLSNLGTPSVLQYPRLLLSYCTLFHRN
jgi:hypothetical protein